MAEKQCPDCKMMIDKGAKVCPHCRKKFGLTWPAKIFLALVILGLIGYLFGPSKNTNYKSTRDTLTNESQDVHSGQEGSDVRLGQEGRLSGTTGTISPVAITEDALDQFLKSHSVNDRDGMAYMIGVGLVFTVDNGTKVLVIDSGLFKRKVRILEGKMKGRTGWVPDEWIKPL